MTEPHHTGRARRGLSILAMLLLVAFVLLVGIWIGGHPRQSGIDRLPGGVRDALVDEDRTALATQVLAILEDSYYKDLDPAVVEKVEGASVETLVRELGDPYTEYLDPDQYGAFQDDRAGKYGGIGVEWHPDGDTALIVTVFKDAPAADAGLRVRDRVTAVDGVKVTREDNFAAMQRVKGDEGTPVTLRIARDGVPERDYTMTREEIRRPVVESRVERFGDKRIGYVRLEQFTDGSAKNVEQAVRRLIEQKVDGLVFDLRGDGGGLVDEAVGVAGVFLPDGTKVAATRGRSGPRETLEVDGSPVDTKLPMVVLVDQASASASEIVAGALRDAGRAKLVGTRTFGKALIQSTRPLANGGAIKFTVASYLTPEGFDLSASGLPPDVSAVDNPTTTEVDEALRRALREVTAS